ncbi:hypothetical protein B0H13DRAFT_2356453 [Mycena leptocephala]|nr:hypothetical protein B0H13DRAFT_2356453 [Mycena leptocephala]
MACYDAGRGRGAEVEVLRLAFGQEDKYEDGPNLKQHNIDIQLALERLRNLRSQGLAVDIQSSLKWFGRNIGAQMLQEINS